MLREFREKLSSRPIDGLRDIGVDPRRLMEDAVHEDDPGYRRAREIERTLAEERAARARIEERMATWEKERKEFEEQQSAARAREARERVEKTFLEEAGKHSDAEHLRELFGRRDKSFVLSAHQLADELRAEGIIPTPSLVVQYMARLAREERAAKSPQVAEAASGTPPKGQVGQAKPTTLGAQESGTRRASTKRFDDLSEEEQYAELLRVADEAAKSA